MTDYNKYKHYLVYSSRGGQTSQYYILQSCKCCIRNEEAFRYSNYVKFMSRIVGF